MRGPNVMKGYYRKPEATAEAIDKDGFFHTGDIGILDADGFLAITDRKKDILVTSGGKNIAPQPIENRLKTDQFFAEVVMVGNQRHFAVALVVPNFELLEKWGREKGLAFASREELLARPEVVGLLRRPGSRSCCPSSRPSRRSRSWPCSTASSRSTGRAHPHPEGQAPGDRAEVQGADRPAVRRRRLEALRARASLPGASIALLERGGRPRVRLRRALRRPRRPPARAPAHRDGGQEHLPRPRQGRLQGLLRQHGPARPHPERHQRRRPARPHRPLQGRQDLPHRDRPGRRRLDRPLRALRRKRASS